MKIYIQLGVLISLFAVFTSCKDWLDLKPDTDATEGQVFSTAEGYRSVLNGLYKTMGSKYLYGRELSFGMLDCMSQQYDMTSENMETEDYIAADAYDYSNTYLSEIITNVWKKGFNIIANANNLIQNIEKASPDLFSQGEMERKMIMGEAYACRALMHFDLLRLYAPAPVNDDHKPYVPYVETYPDIQANGMEVNAFLGKVIQDLEKARELVIDFDTTALGKSVVVSGGSRFYNSFEFGTEAYNRRDIDGFFEGRGYRLNYYSITALLARVYQYAGQHSVAKQMAREVLDFNLEGPYGRIYQFFYDDFSDIKSSDWNRKSDLRLVNSLIFGVYNAKAYDELQLLAYFNPNFSRWDRPNYFVINQKNQKIFNTTSGVDESLYDYRFVYLVNTVADRFPISGKWYYSTDENIRKNNVTILPVIRSSEMRYIEAESYAREGNFAEAKRILQEMRDERGCVESIHVEKWEDFVAELIQDARREWISEGQLFYLYKRLNAEVNFGKNEIRPLKRNEYLLPIPDDQSL